MRVEVNADNLMCATCGELMYRRPYNCVHSLENTHVSAYVEVPDPAPAQPQAPVPNGQQWEHCIRRLDARDQGSLKNGTGYLIELLDAGWELLSMTATPETNGTYYSETYVLRRPRQNDAPQGEEVAP